MIVQHEDRACYADGDERLWAALVLLRTAHELFMKAPAVQNLAEIQTLATRSGIPRPEQTHSIFLLTDSVLDAFCIVAAFEHAVKGLLVRQGIAIHEIDGRIPAARPLLEKQRREPVTVAEVLALEDRLYPQAVRPRTEIRVLKQQTVSLSRLLEKAPYIAQVGLDQAILEALLPIVGRRNRLTHLFSIWFGYPILKAVTEYASLKAYIVQQVVPAHNELVDRIGYDGT